MICPGPHLGDDVAAVVDGELTDRVRARALRHLLHCAWCRQEVEAARAVKARVNGLHTPLPAALTDRLVAMSTCGPTAPPGSTASGPTALGPTALGPTALGPTALGPTALGPTALGPTASGPTAIGPTAPGPAGPPTGDSRSAAARRRGALRPPGRPAARRQRPLSRLPRPASLGGAVLVLGMGVVLLLGTARTAPARGPLDPGGSTAPRVEQSGVEQSGVEQARNEQAGVGPAGVLAPLRHWDPAGMRAGLVR